MTNKNDINQSIIITYKQTMANYQLVIIRKTEREEKQKQNIDIQKKKIKRKARNDNKK